MSSRFAVGLLGDTPSPSKEDSRILSLDNNGLDKHDIDKHFLTGLDKHGHKEKCSQFWIDY